MGVVVARLTVVPPLFWVAPVNNLFPSRQGPNSAASSVDVGRNRMTVWGDIPFVP